MIDLGKRNILGVKICAIDYQGAVERIVAAAKTRQALTVSALAVHGLMTGVMDAEHRYRLNHLDLLVPDGQPIRWALNALYGARLPERVYGPELMLQSCQRAAEEGLPVFLFGGSPELLEALRTRLLSKFPDLQIAGTRPSKFRRLRQEERDELVAEIKDSGAAITLVGLGLPRQEVWLYEFRSALEMPLLAVGAAFTFHAGLLPQAPPCLQARGLEWAFRLLQEPRRLWRRYLLLNPLYVSLLTAQALHVHRFDPHKCTRPRRDVFYG